MTALLQNKVAIITGTARGIGQATAELFALHGARVLMSDIDAQPLNETAAAIQKTGGNVVPLAGDVTDPAFPEKLVKTALEKFGGFDILVNNAGYTWDAVLHKMTDQQWQAIIDCHLTAPFRIIRAASEYWRESAKKDQAAGGTAKPRKIVQYQLDQRHARQSRTSQLFVGQGRHHWLDQDPGPRVGPVQYPVECRGLRLDRYPADSP